VEDEQLAVERPQGNVHILADCRWNSWRSSERDFIAATIRQLMPQHSTRQLK
jgi:hypothetical protein